MPHSPISPKIHYWGTPVVLLSTLNQDHTPNLAPISSAFWLADRCILGLLACSQTTFNLLRTRQCVLNLPSDDMADAVSKLAKTTGTQDVPELKKRLGYIFEKDKFGVAGLTEVESEMVEPPRVEECEVQIEAEVIGVHEMLGGGGEGDGGFKKGDILAVEVRVLRTWVEDRLRVEGFPNRVDSDVWRPLIMSFQRFYGLREGRVGYSRLAEIEEEMYGS